MLDFKAGTDVSVTYEFFDEDYFVPDMGTVTYTLYDASGNPITPLIDVPVTTDSNTTKITITIPLTYNTFTGSLTYRKVAVRYSLSGNSKIGFVNYRLYSDFSTWVTPETIRNYLGLNIRELPDSDIDILASYMKLKNILGDTVFNNTLSSTDIKLVHLNNAIRSQTALDLLPSIRLRVTRKESDGSLNFHRMEIIDFDAIEKMIRNDLDAAINELVSVPSTTSSYKAGIVITTRPDVITGE